MLSDEMSTEQAETQTLPAKLANTVGVAGPDRPFRFEVIDLLRLAIPMIVSRAGLATMAIADSVMVARFSPSQFASLSLADGTLGKLVEVFIAFIIGGLVLVPRAYGAGAFGECVRLWKRSVPPALALGLVGAALGLAGTPLFHLLGQPLAVSSSAGQISAVLGSGYMAALLAVGAAVFLEGMRSQVFVAASVVGANVLNIVLNWFLIAGHAGFPSLGALGSAISTTIVRFALAISLAGYAWWTFARKQTSDGVNEPISPEGLQHRIGLSSAVVQAIMLILSASLLIFAGWLGALPLAALAAVWTLNAPAMLIALGVSDATSVRIASAEGSKTDSKEAATTSSRSILQTSLITLTAVISIFLIAFLLFPFDVASLFTLDPAMRRSLAELIPFAGGLLLLDGVSYLAVSGLRALRDIAWPTFIEISTMAALVPVAAFLAFHEGRGVLGLIIAAIASATCRTILLMWRFLRLTSSSQR